MIWTFKRTKNINNNEDEDLYISNTQLVPYINEELVHEDEDKELDASIILSHISFEVWFLQPSINKGTKIIIL